MTAGKFYSASITSLGDFDDYLNAKGYKHFQIIKVDGDYYAELPKGSPNLKDFSQTGLRGPHWLAKGTKPGAKYEWVRLGSKDCTNKLILNA